MVDALRRVNPAATTRIDCEGVVSPIVDASAAPPRNDTRGAFTNNGMDERQNARILSIPRQDRYTSGAPTISS